MKGTKRGSAKSKQKKQLLVVYVLDETGSMGTVKDATVSGFNEYVRTLASKNGHGAAMSLITFNSDQGAKRRFSDEPVKNVPRLTAQSYLPAACTPLYDAIMEGIHDADGAKGKDIVFVIHTDGEENASKRATRDEIFRLIEERKKAGWAFVFLGADQDAWQAAQLIGIARGSTVSYDATSGGTVAAFGSVASATSNYASYDVHTKGIARQGLMSYSTTGGKSVSMSVDLRKKNRRKGVGF